MLDIEIDSSVPHSRTSIGGNATITLSHHTNTISKCSMRTLVLLEAHMFHNVVVLGTYALDATVRSPQNHHPVEISHEKYQLGIALFSLLGAMQQSLGLSIHHTPFVQSSLQQLKRNLHQWIDEFHIHATARQRLDDEHALERFVAFGERQAPFEDYAHTLEQQQGYPTPSPTSTQATSQSDKPLTSSPTSTTATSPPDESSAPVGPPVHTFTFTPPGSPTIPPPSGLRSHESEGHVILHRRPKVADHDILSPSGVADARAGDKTDDEDEDTKRTRWEDRKESGRRGVGQKSPFARGPGCIDMNFETARVWTERQRRREEAREAASTPYEKLYEMNAAIRRYKDKALYKSSNGEDGASDRSTRASTKRTLMETEQEPPPRSLFASSSRSTLYDICDYCNF